MRWSRFGAYVPRFTSISTLAVVLWTISVTPSNGQAARRRDGIRRNQRPVSGRYLVVLRSGDDPSLSAMAAEGVGRGRVRHIYRHAMRGFTIDTSEAAARAIAQDPLSRTSNRTAWLQSPAGNHLGPMTTGDWIALTNARASAMPRHRATASTATRLTAAAFTCT